MSKFICPKCGSEHIFELFYGSSNWQCLVCRYSADKKQFPKEGAGKSKEVKDEE